MAKVIPNSVYIVHSRCISLVGRPFLASEEVQPAFRFMFGSKGCFTDFLRRQGNGVKNPFVSHLGSIGLGPTVERMLDKQTWYWPSALALLFSDAIPKEQAKYYTTEEWLEHRKDAEKAIGLG